MIHKLFSFCTILLILSSCSARVPLTDTFQGQGLKIGKVEVSIDKQLVDSERLDVFNKLDGANVVQSRTVELLKQKQLFDPASDVVIALKVYDFRLRHGATRFFTGMYSGSDNLFANMVVRKNDSILLSTEIKASGGNGNPFNISRDSRGSGLFNGASKLVVAALRRERISK